MFTLSSRWLSFIQGGVAITVGSRDENNRPNLARGQGCRVSPDGQKVTVLVSRSQAVPVLDSLSQSGAVAVVFSEPSTHTAIQLKGTDAAFASVQESDRAIVLRHTDEFVVDAGRVGYPEVAIRTLVWCDLDDLVAITFTPLAGFLQTPGPRAGAPLQ